MQYKAIFIDIDDTLLDYVPCCREAFHEAMEVIRSRGEEEIGGEEKLFNLFFAISGRLFSEAKHGLHTISEVMELYPREFVERMNELTNEGMNEAERSHRTDIFKHAFRAAWGKTHTLVPGAKELLAHLHAKGYRLFAASNSFGHLQRSRLEQAGIAAYFEDTYISMDIGYDKPDVRFYEEALRRCGLSAREVLMVGDSMTTDILGAKKAGIDAVYFDRGRSVVSSQPSEKKEEWRTISSLAQLDNLL